MQRSRTSTRFPYTTLFRSVRIEPGRGFVEEQHAWGHDEARGQVEPTAHATRVLPDWLAVGLGEGELAEQFVGPAPRGTRSEEHTSELQSPVHLVCRLLLEK